MTNLLKKTAAVVTTLALAGSMFASAAFAAPPSFGLVPFEYVGAAGDCGANYPAGSDIVTAKWTTAEGNSQPSIFLQKDGPTSDCSSAGVDVVTPLEGGSVSALTELNFDYKNDGHCGAGAPRFNVQVDGNTYFLGCSGGVQTATGNQDWTHVEFGPTEFAAAGIPVTGTLEDVYMVFDEGTDTPTGGTIVTPGEVYVDNFSVNASVVGSPTTPQDKEACKKGGWKDFFPTFKNQGDCVSFSATGGKNLPSGL